VTDFLQSYDGKNEPTPITWRYRNFQAIDRVIEQGLIIKSYLSDHLEDDNLHKQQDFHLLCQAI